MYWFTRLPTFLLYLSLYPYFTAAAPRSRFPFRTRQTLLPRQSPSTNSSSATDTYLRTEAPLAQSLLLANIGPTGSNAQQAPPGIVLAAPSQGNILSLFHWIFPSSQFFDVPPGNYSLFTWVRDSAIVGHVLVDQVQLGIDTSLRPYLGNYVSAQKLLYDAANSTSDGLGQDIFFINGSSVPSSAAAAPHRFVPALRAITMISWGNLILTQKNTTYFNLNMWPIIQGDLNYLADNWNKTGLDVWEELDTSSFFTTLVQHRALRQGQFLAEALGQKDLESNYKTQADASLCFLQSFWSASGFMTANTNSGRSGIDASTVLASVHGFDIGAGCDPVTFQPCSDRALANLAAYINMTSKYNVNSNASAGQGMAVGRYPEDTDLSGNPWYITTLAVAQQLYSALSVWDRQKTLTVTSLSQPFFNLIVPGTAPGVYAAPSNLFASITSAARTYADSFVTIVAQYTAPGGHLSQQFSSINGLQMGPRDFSWSYAALLSAVATRNGTVAPTWGAQGLTANATCSRNLNADGSNDGTGKVMVDFNVQATTVLGENIYIAGSDAELGNWSPDQALLLSSANYPTWNITLQLPASTMIQYKYIRKFNGGVTWESDPNQEFTTPESGNFSIFDMWR